MMKTTIWCATLLCAVSVWQGTLEAAMEFRTEHLKIGVGDKGQICELTARATGKSYLPPKLPAPVLTIRVDGTMHVPDAASEDNGGRIKLRYGKPGVTVTVAVTPKPTHVVLEVITVEPKDLVELVLWGPFPTTINRTIGETVGIVRNEQFAIGIMSLNPKTIGGYPRKENDCMHIYYDDDLNVYDRVWGSKVKKQRFWGETAKRTEFGSILQAYCRDRSQPRVIENWSHKKYQVPVYADGGVVGSAVALYGCPADQGLATIGKIEVAEGLPHPMIDGKWVKTSPLASASYFIFGYGTHNIDQAITLAKKAGLHYIYTQHPFSDWGHFNLNQNHFPENWESMRKCAKKARQQGIGIGFHTLSNFITQNDAYVRPKPDQRLARIGSSPLTTNLDDHKTEILIGEPDFFKKKTPLNAVIIDDELIQYNGVSADEPWRLQGCQRGAYGTKAASHLKGSAVGKVMDHSYNVFLPNMELSIEMAQRLGDLCNKTGISIMSLDGLEGTWSTGMGEYSRVLFCQAWYNRLKPELRGMINDASNTSHYNWHINTRANWGELWGNDIRNSGTDYRIMNQAYFSRNYLPGMLGWFNFPANSPLSDTEWVLARAAGFDAGFALATSVNVSSSNLKAIRNWETARLAGAFPKELKPALQDGGNEFHLEAFGKGKWKLYPVPDPKAAPGKYGAPIVIPAKKPLDMETINRFIAPKSP